jgi:hypothetical protein
MPALAAPAVAGEQVARPVKPCNAPTTRFSVGRGHRGHTIEPGSFTAEVDGDVIMLEWGDGMKCNPGSYQSPRRSSSTGAETRLPPSVKFRAPPGVTQLAQVQRR